MLQYFLGIKYEFFLAPYRVTFQFFTQTTDQKSFFSYQILANILSINYFMTKKSPNNTP